MLDKIRAAITALNRGEELTHAELWKDRQTAVNTLVALLGALAVFLPPGTLSHDDVLALAGGAAALGGLFNAYLTNATSARVGLPAEPGDDPAAGGG